MEQRRSKQELTFDQVTRPVFSYYHRVIIVVNLVIDTAACMHVAHQNFDYPT
jgi:hypothetical protein